MKTGQIVKWVLIVLAVWIGYRAVNRLIGDIPDGGGSAQAVTNANLGTPVWAPNIYSVGVYGPLRAPWNPYTAWPKNPFFSSPEAPPPPPQWWAW